MITKNVAARDVYFDLHTDPSSLPDDYISAWIMQYTWGQDYYHGIVPALWHGWKLTVTQEADESGGGTPANYTVSFESPFDASTFTDTGAGLHDWWFRVYMDNARIIGQCGLAKLTFDELRITRRTSAGGAETTLYTLTGPFTYTNVSYTENKNCTFVQPTVSGPSASPGAASCPSTFGGAIPADVSAIAAAEYAWKYAVPGSGLWTKDTVEFDNTNPTYGSCVCSATIGDVVYPAPPLNSEWMVLTASFSDQYSKNFLLTQTFTCPGSATPIIVKWNDIERTLESHAISITVHRKGGPMTGREVVTIETCNDNGSSSTLTTTNTTTDPYTICLKETLDYYGHWHTLCDYEISTPPYDPCTPPFGYEPDVPAPDPALYPYCENGISIAQDWLTPSCTNPPFRNLANFHTPWGHFHREHQRIGELEHKRAIFDLPVPSWDNTATLLNDGFDYDINFCYEPLSAGLYVILAHEDPPGTWTTDLTATNDDGETIDTVAALFSNARWPYIRETQEGGLLSAAFRWNTGTSGVGKIKGKTKGPGDSSWSSEFTFKDTSGVDIAFEDAAFAFSPAPESPCRIILTAIKSGDTGPTEFYSADGGLTWTEV